MITTRVSFPKNIYHYCQRNFVDRDLLDVKFSTESRRMGTLPYDWLKNEKQTNYAKLTEKVDKFFRKIATRNRLSYRLEGYERKLSRILKRKDVKIEYVDRGSFKDCHKITIGDYKYALLTFIRDSYWKNQLERDTLNGSGPLVEPCRIFDVYKEYSHGRVAKPFMTRFVNNSNAEKYDGYMLMKFIDDAHSKCDLPAYQQNFYKFNMVDFNQGNVINGVIVDIGQIKENDEYMQSDEFRQNLFNLLGKIEKNHEENFTTVPYKKFGNKANDNWTANHNAEEFIYGLMKDGVDIYNIDIREFIKNLNPLEQKYVIQRIRKLKKVHNLKTKLQQSGEYDKYQPYIEKYVKQYGSWSLRHELN